MNIPDEAVTEDRIVGRAQAHAMFHMGGKPVLLELRESGAVTWRLSRSAGAGE
jgi:hypothetical protein